MDRSMRLVCSGSYAKEKRRQKHSQGPMYEHTATTVPQGSLGSRQLGKKTCEA